MKHLIALMGLTCVAGVGPAAAQNLVITNARILDGSGKVIERGAMLGPWTERALRRVDPARARSRTATRARPAYR